MKHYQFLFFGVMLAAVLVLLDIALEHQGWRWTSPDAGTASGLRYGYLAVICLLCVGSGWLGSKLAKREAVQRRKTQEVDAVWNAILERGPIGIAVLSPKMEQLYYNEKALRQLGLTEKIETGTSAFSVSTQWTVFSQEGEQLSSEERPLARLPKPVCCPQLKVHPARGFARRALSTWVERTSNPRCGSAHRLIGPSPK